MQTKLHEQFRKYWQKVCPYFFERLPPPSFADAVIREIGQKIPESVERFHLSGWSVSHFQQGIGARYQTEKQQGVCLPIDVHPDRLVEDLV